MTTFQETQESSASLNGNMKQDGESHVDDEPPAPGTEEPPSKKVRIEPVPDVAEVELDWLLGTVARCACAVTVFLHGYMVGHYHSDKSSLSMHHYELSNNIIQNFP